MTKSIELLRRSENCEELAQTARDDAAKNRLKRLAEGWRTVAETQAWLDGESDPAGQATP